MIDDDGDDEDRAAMKAALIQAAGGRAALRVVGDPPMGVDAHAVVGLVRAAGELAAEAAYGCDDADIDLAALTECKLSVEGRARLAAHLGRCAHCLEVATSLMHAMEDERRTNGPGRGPVGGVGGLA